jgi:hypothetical protein
VDRLGIEFIDLEEDAEDGDSAMESEAQDEVDTADEAPDVVAAPEVVEELPEDAPGLGKSFDDEVEAEVAELLGEIDPPGGPSSDDTSTDEDQH